MLKRAALALAILAAPLAAQASVCPTYPYTLTNGQTADANQVMADFSAILSCANTSLASAGVNSNITALIGLTTPLSLMQGGTGQTSLSGLQTALGLGTAAYANTGVSGATVPLLSGAATTWASGATFGGGVNVTGALVASGGGWFTTTLAQGWGVRVAADPANTAGLLQFTDTAGSNQWAVLQATATGGLSTASLAVTGQLTAPTPAPGDNTTKAATTAYVQTALSSFVLTPPIAQFRNQQVSGTGPGETIAATTWTQRLLNTTVSNTIPGASLSSNQVTLPAGVYEVFASAETGWSSGVGGSKLRLRDITAGSTIVSGMNANGSSYAVPTLQGKFTLGASHVVEVDSYISNTGGFGGGFLSSGEVEVYVDVYFRKVG